MLRVSRPADRGLNEELERLKTEDASEKPMTGWKTYYGLDLLPTQYEG